MRGDAPMTLPGAHRDTLPFILFTRNEEVSVIYFRLKGCILAKTTTRLTGINKEEANDDKRSRLNSLTREIVTVRQEVDFLIKTGPVLGGTRAA
jgi:hypothetical protein